MECIFCKIVAGTVPATVVYEDDHVLAFRDINPVAPEHILIIPREHVDSLDSPLAVEPGARALAAVQAIVKQQGLDKTGFRVVCNTGANGGQTVNHLHFHLLGGRPLEWPPG